MPILTVSLAVEVSRPIVFNRWLPMNPEETITLSDQGVRISISFPLESTWSVFQPTEEEISRTENNRAHRIMVTLETKVSEALGSGMTQQEKLSDPLCSEYKRLGIKLEAVAIGRINRLISYARSVKGQFWVDELEPDPRNPGQFFIRSSAEARVDGVPIRFDPDQRRISILARMNPWPDRMLGKQDWPLVRDFVTGDSRSPLVGLLLANARRLAEQGSRRNALVEAVTALEVALAAFARRAQFDRLDRFGSRIEVGSVKSLIDKLGFRGTFAVAIPMIFSEEEFPLTILKLCRDAIANRNSIVHQGKRDVRGEDLDKMLTALEESCAIFMKFTDTSNEIAHPSSR